MKNPFRTKTAQPGLQSSGLFYVTTFRTRSYSCALSKPQHIPKSFYIPTAHPGSRYFYLQEEYHMSRKKKPQTLPELYAAKEETENELRKAKQKEKILQNQISKLTRNARTHRLCTRAGMLESFLPNPELLTDEDLNSRKL